MEGVADEDSLREVRKRLAEIKPKSLTLGFQSLAESMIRRGWLNPFPKIRTTERPDTASAQLLEGSVLVICDTSPQVMIFPTSIFDYLEETDDFYFPPLTGTYLRLVRTLIFLLSVFITPLWYLAVEYAELLPKSLSFIVPENPGPLPLILQLFLVELAIDGLKIASMNTPNILSNSLAVVGGLILGDFAVEVGWLCADVILYMAFVAIANFAGQNYELGYAFKFSRLIILTLVYFFGVLGLVLGTVIFCIMVASNKTLGGKHRYLYPLIPFDSGGFFRLIVRRKKQDFTE
jgi:stage V sporulation protein AF